MASNDKILLDQILDEEQKARYPSLGKSQFFDTFVAEQILKDYDLSDEEIASGIVDGSGDGGIDGFYTFANGELVREDFDAAPLKKNGLIEVIIMQSKTSDGFTEDAINKLVFVTRDLLDLSHKLDDYKSVYNESVRTNAEIFRNLYLATATRFPRLVFKCFYATRGDKTSVHPNVARKVDDLKSVFAKIFSDASFAFDFLGASELLSLARRQPKTSYTIGFTENFGTQGGFGYVALVGLKEFSRFISDETGLLRKSLFEANVRDFQGKTEVNDAIKKSLVERGAEDFWWLNNGVTIITTKAVLNGKEITLEDPQIVNGLQTSTVIHSYCAEANTDKENRNVMVRVIIVQDAAVRDRIIKATNSQTQIPLASLRATDKIHRDIESYLSPFGLFYDRRKNAQKNAGKAADSIVSIPFMAQSVMAIVLQRPNDARARPSSLLKSEEDYSLVFSNNYPLEVFFVATKLVKLVQLYMQLAESFTTKEKSNLLHYIAMCASCFLCKKAHPQVSDIAAIKIDALNSKILDDCSALVRKLYEEQGADDKAAKGKELIVKLKTALEAELSPTPLLATATA